MSSYSMPLVPAPTKMQQQLMSAASNKIQQLRNDRHMFAASDDNAMMKQILTTHTPDGRIVEVKPLISVIENIFVRATPPVTAITTHEAQTHLELSEDKTFQSGFADMLDLLAFTISKISCEISCKCSGSGDAHMTTVSIFNMLSSYSWDGASSRNSPDRSRPDEKDIKSNAFISVAADDDEINLSSSS